MPTSPSGGEVAGRTALRLGTHSRKIADPAAIVKTRDTGCRDWRRSPNRRILVVNIRARRASKRQAGPGGEAFAWVCKNADFTTITADSWRAPAEMRCAPQSIGRWSRTSSTGCRAIYSASTRLSSSFAMVTRCRRSSLSRPNKMKPSGRLLSGHGSSSAMATTRSLVVASLDVCSSVPGVSCRQADKALSHRPTSSEGGLPSEPCGHPPVRRTSCTVDEHGSWHESDHASVDRICTRRR